MCVCRFNNRKNVKGARQISLTPFLLWYFSKRLLFLNKLCEGITVDKKVG